MNITAAVQAKSSLYHVPSGKKNASDKKILVDMLLWVLENPAPANIMLISGDGDFSDALYRLRMKGYNILLAHPPQASPLLVACATTAWLWGSLFPDSDISNQQVLSKQSMNSVSNTNRTEGNKLKGIYVPKASTQLMQQQNCTKRGESAWFCKVCKHGAQWKPKQNLKLLVEPESKAGKPSECHEKDVEMANKTPFDSHPENAAIVKKQAEEEKPNKESMKSLEEKNKELVETSGRELRKVLKERLESEIGAPLNIDFALSELSRDLRVPKELRECFEAILKKLEPPSIDEIVIEKFEEGMPKQGSEMKSNEPESPLAGPSEHLEDKTEAYVCTICSVICDSPIVFESHLLGRRHAAGIKKHEEVLFDDKRILEESLEAKDHPIDALQEVRFQPEGIEYESEVEPREDEVVSEEDVMNNQSWVCNWCMVRCSSQVDFDSHLAGKKHAANQIWACNWYGLSCSSQVHFDAAAVVNKQVSVVNKQAPTKHIYVRKS